MTPRLYRVPTRIQRLIRALVGDDQAPTLVYGLERDPTAPTGAVRRTLWLCRQVLTLGLWIVVDRLAPGRRRPTLPGERGGPVLFSELRFAVRLIAKQPVVAATAVLALAVGIGLATFAFTFLNETLWATLPLPDGERFVYLSTRDLESGRDVSLGQARYAELAARSQTLATIAAFATRQFNLELPDTPPVPLSGVWIEPRALRLLRERPLAGRSLLDTDATPGAEPVVLLAEDIWRVHFGADPEVVGTTLLLSGEARTVVGVLPRSVGFPTSARAWLPLDARTPDPAAPDTQFRLFAVLKPAVSRPQAQAELSGILARLRDPREEPNAERQLGVSVVPYTQGFYSEGFDLFLIGAVSVLVLLLAVAAANVANLILVRTSARSTELAVRSALCASRGRLVMQIFVEVLLLGTGAAILGTIGARATMTWIEAMVADELPFWVQLEIAPRVLAFVAGCAVLASAIASVVPALRATARPLDAALRDGGGAVSGTRFGRVSSALIVAELAASVALLALAAVFGQGLQGYLAQDLGLDEDRLLTATLYRPPPADFDISAGAPEGAFPPIPAEILEDLRATPGVDDATLALDIPKVDAELRPFELESMPPAQSIDSLQARAALVGQRFFETLGARLIEGRTFRPEDFEPGAVRVAIVNDSFVREYFGGRNPVGERVRWRPREPDGEPLPWMSIVGVAPELGLSPGNPSRRAGIYRPYTSSNWARVVVRTRGPAAAMATTLREVVARHDTEILVREIQTLEQTGWEARALLQGAGAALLLLGGMALLLSVAGTYAIMAHSVQSRTREIGIRIALGATGSKVLHTLLRRALVQLGTGAGLGIGLGFLLRQSTRILPIDVPAEDPTGTFLVAGLMVAAGLAACWVPARRAFRIRPAEALRAE